MKPEELKNALKELTESALNAPGRNHLNSYNKNLLLDAIEELEKLRARKIKKLEFKVASYTMMEAEGVNCSYRITSKEGKCFAVKSIYYVGYDDPIPFATFELASKWCNEDFEKAVGKFLQNP